MSFSIVRLFRRPKSVSCRRPSRRPIEVESMEPRALLTSAAAAAAIVTVQQAEVSVKQEISAEIATLKSNIVTIEQATTTFLADYGLGDKATTIAAIRDEKFAIGQQLFLISVLGQSEQAYDSVLGTGISGLKAGRLDPATVSNILTAAESTLESELSTVDATATYELSGLTGTFAAGKT